MTEVTSESFDTDWSYTIDREVWTKIYTTIINNFDQIFSFLFFIFLV